MTDSMNFGPEWLRNLSSEGTTASTSSGGTRYQLAEYRYSREDMLALFEKNVRPPLSLCQFSSLYSDQCLSPWALLPQGEEERTWPRATPMGGGMARGRGGSLERGGRGTRGRGTYPTFGRGGFESGGSWGNGEQSDWSPRKEYTNNRSSSVDNWRRSRDEDEGWRNSNQNRPPNEKWVRSTSWREDSGDDRGDRGHGWHNDGPRSHTQRRMWDTDDHLPEWATEHLSEGGGTFDASGAFHGSDEEQVQDNKGYTPNKKETPLQKSVSHHNITYKNHPPPLTSSQSATSLTKSPEANDKKEVDKEEKQEAKPIDASKISTKEEPDVKKSASPPAENKAHIQEQQCVGPPQKQTISNVNGLAHDPGANNRADEEYERFSEDIVKLVDEPSKATQPTNSMPVMGGAGPMQPPPKLTPHIQDKWYYQDPQGDLQGPFSATEMTEWLKAGYFSAALLVKRHSDERFFMLGELMASVGNNPFMSLMRYPLIKPDLPKMPDQDVLQQLQFMQMAQQSQFAMRGNERAFGQGEPWASLSQLQQRDLFAAQQLMSQPQIPGPDLQYLQQQHSNSFMNIINQMQAADKLQNQAIPEKPPSSMPQLNPLQQLVQQMGGMQQIHNRIPSATSGLSGAPNMPTGLPVPTGLAGPAGLAGPTGMPNQGGLTGSRGMQGAAGLSASTGLPPAVLSGAIMPNTTGLSSVLPGSSIPGLGIPGNLQTDTLTNTLSGIHGGIPAGGLTAGNSMAGLPGSLSGPGVMASNLGKTSSIGSVDTLVNSDGALNSLLRQLQQNKQPQQVDSLWQQNQYIGGPQQTPQWQQSDTPISMWDLQNSNPPPVTTATVTPASTAATPVSIPQQQPIPNDAPAPSPVEEQSKPAKATKEKSKESGKEEKKRKELEEKQAKKEVEEKRKQEQRKQELEKKAAEEKKKKEEERIRKELEKAKKEAEEKRLRELEEKRKQKEQRKLEEENRRKADEIRKQEEEERERREQKMREEQERRQAEEHRKAQEMSIRVAKAAPWSVTNQTSGTSLEEIQKAERQRRAEQAAMLQQQKLQQQMQQSPEKPSSMLLCWANNPIKPRQVKSLAEIQAEEQERLTRQVQEARLAQLQKEKEIIQTSSVPTIWSGQNLNWSNNSNSNWGHSGGGFWDEASSQKPTTKPSTLPKSNSTSAISGGKVQPQTNKQQQVSQPSKPKVKKEEHHSTKNGPAPDEFTIWCTKALTNMKSSVDIPTFISLLRDIESAYDVREICRDYLGDGPMTNQFANQFLEKRRSFKPKMTTQKDDMCSPAPAITPSNQHNTDFQEVRSNRKKAKKSKMLKVDARILGFSVTAAHDRINVGDRDYVDTA